jgi:hypothetical protein
MMLGKPSRRPAAANDEESEEFFKTADSSAAERRATLVDPGRDQNRRRTGNYARRFRLPRPAPFSPPLGGGRFASGGAS